MHCAKVVFGCLENGFTLKKLYGGNVVKLNSFFHKVKQYSTFSIMEEKGLLDPPESARGMKVLNKDAFRKRVTVCCLTVDKRNLGEINPLLKNSLLKINAIKPICELDENRSKLLLNPDLIKAWQDFGEEVTGKLKDLKVTEDNFSKEPLDLGYENWNSAALLKAVLPKDEPPLHSFSIIGHIVHLNIKDHLLDYKYVIAEILMDNLKHIKTVVSKTSAINNVYRNFEMELVRGEPNYFVTVKENACTFEFDFSKVYWNPRLGTEHSRIINLVTSRDVMFDVFAGVGPFSIPAAKKLCTVFANDLNPDSIKWLEHNVMLNKKAKDNITVSNKDGSDFILTDVKENLMKTWQDEYFSGKIHVVMNLPALAPTFIKYFKGLVTRDDVSKLDLTKAEKFLPIFHCYFFGLKTEEGKTVFEGKSGIALDSLDYSLHEVRAVSQTKLMFRATFKLPMSYMLMENVEVDEGEPLAKKFCAG